MLNTNRGIRTVGHLSILIAAAIHGGATLRADNIAFDNQAGILNLQNYSGSLGLGFSVNSPIVVTQLGAFDNGNPALLNGDDNTSGITAQIYNSTNGLPYGPSVTFSVSNPGTQVNGDAFLTLPQPLYLPAGFTGSIVVSNDPNYNGGGAANSTSTPDASGFLTFTGPAYGNAGSYPVHPDGGPVNQYDAGTFAFQPSAIAIANPSGVSPLQGFTGSLGLGFTVNAGQNIAVSSLGVFDNGSPANLAGSDGHSGVTVGIYDQTTGQLVPGSSTQTFTTATPGSQVGGDAFLPVTPFLLGPGHYSIVTFNDNNYNSGQGGGTNLGTFNGAGGAISPAPSPGGGGYYNTSTTSISYPSSQDGNSYNSGTFSFQPNSIAFNNPGSIPSGELQNFQGSLGLGFNVNAGHSIYVTSLGAFDNGNTANLAGSDGHSGVTVGIYNQATGQLISQSLSETFTPSSSASQIGGDAFLPVTPFLLGPGHYSIVTFNDGNYNEDAGAGTGRIQRVERLDFVRTQPWRWRVLRSDGRKFSRHRRRKHLQRRHVRLCRARAGNHHDRRFGGFEPAWCRTPPEVVSHKCVHDIRKPPSQPWGSLVSVVEGQLTNGPGATIVSRENARAWQSAAAHFQFRNPQVSFIRDLAGCLQGNNGWPAPRSRSVKLNRARLFKLPFAELRRPNDRLQA